MRAPAALAAAGSVATAGGYAPPIVAGLGLAWLLAVGGWAWWAERRDPARWPEPALRRGRHPGCAAWIVDVPAGGGPAARALAGRLGAAGAAATFFVGPEEHALAEALAALGQEPAWLGLPRLAGGEGARLPAGTVVRGVPARRAPFWRPAGARPGAAELALAHAVGARLVVPTLRLRAPPDTLTLVATDLVQVPLSVPDALVDAWLADCAARAVRVATVSAASEAPSR